MRASIILSAAFALTASATLTERQRDCQGDYTKCQAAGRSLVACQCDLATCSGEDNARTREYCASATASLSTASSTSSAAQGPSSAPQIAIDAVPGSLKLGQQCSETSQCAGGAQCWASNAMLQKACGNFNAACTANSQCAYNTCNNGLCNGFLPTGSYPANTATATGKTNGTVATGTVKAPSGTSTGVVKFTGAASKEQVGAGVALVAALFAAAL